MNLLFKAIVGSQSYGTAIETSDIDYKGVYLQSISDLVSFRYKPQIEINKDEMYYEVRRFLELLLTANPTVLELLFSPEDCIMQSSPQFHLLQQHRQKFLTRKCQLAFGGYAVAQIKKAKGLDKKMNWEKGRVTRKLPIDFAFAYQDGQTMPLQKWLDNRGFEAEKCGLTALNHFRGGFALYYDPSGKVGLRGISGEESNELRLSSVPKGMEAQTVVYYNADGYSTHCKEFNDYQVWLEKRNTQRYVDVQGHQQQIDGKNLLHCRRLLDMALEIPVDKTIHVRRPDAAELLKIRRGEVPLEVIIEQAEADLERLESVYATSDLPDEVSFDFVQDLLLEIRGFKK